MDHVFLVHSTSAMLCGATRGYSWCYMEQKDTVPTQETFYSDQKGMVPPQGIADVIWVRRIWCHQREHLILHGPEGRDGRKGYCSCCIDQKTRCHLYRTLDVTWARRTPCHNRAQLGNVSNMWAHFESKFTFPVSFCSLQAHFKVSWTVSQRGSPLTSQCKHNWLWKVS